jgi:SAM-dependent methyltransferase
MHVLDDHRMTGDEIIASIEQRGFREIAARYQNAHPNVRKYLDLATWIPTNLRRLERLKLDAPARILDLGCGAGYFLYICKLLGHDVRGVDVPDEPMYRALTKALGVPVEYAQIEPFVKLPPFGAIDVMTAYMVTFNGHCVKPWGPGEWAFLLDDVGAQRFSIELNREPDRTLYPPGLREFFASRGARIESHRVLL